MTTTYSPTEARKDLFLETLATSGSFAEAAGAASPHLTPSGKKRNGRYRYKGVTTFKRLYASDPRFRESVDEATGVALGTAEQAAYDRAVNGWLEPIYQAGVQVGTVRRFDNRLLLAVLRKMNPEWRETSNLEVKGKLQHQNVSVSLGISLTSEDLDLLPEESQRQLLVLLNDLAAKKLE